MWRDHGPFDTLGGIMLCRELKQTDVSWMFKIKCIFVKRRLMQKNKKKTKNTELQMMYTPRFIMV